MRGRNPGAGVRAIVASMRACPGTATEHAPGEAKPKRRGFALRRRCMRRWFRQLQTTIARCRHEPRANPSVC